MKIATWNVNSVKVRLPHLEKFLKDEDIDILGIQELKTEEKSFPTDFFEALGYHCAVFGQKAYNGVALISKMPLASVKKMFWRKASQERSKGA